MRACVGVRPQKLRFYMARCAIGTLTHPFGVAKQKLKPTQKVGLNFWQGHLCNSRTDFIHNLLQFGKEIKTFLQIL